jgi:cold shock protein
MGTGRHGGRSPTTRWSVLVPPPGAQRGPAAGRDPGAQQKEVLPVATGTVKFFNAEKGYGFISREGEKDVFVHYSNIVGSGYRTLEADQRVEFEVQPGQKGDEAVNVRVV